MTRSSPTAIRQYTDAGMAWVGQLTTLYRAAASSQRVPVTVIGALILAGGMLTGCRSSDSDAGPEPAPAEAQTLTAQRATEELIAGPVAEAARLGPLLPVCPDMTGAVPGESFTCTASTEEQKTVRLTATIQPTGQVELATTNVITVDALPSFEQAAIDALNTTIDVPLSYEDIDCGPASVVINDDASLVCALRDPQTQAIFDVTLSFTDLEARQFSLVVADAPRR